MVTLEASVGSSSGISNMKENVALDSKQIDTEALNKEDDEFALLESKFLAELGGNN